MKTYLAETSNKFDFFLVIIALPTLLGSVVNLNFLRSLRVIRSLRECL